MFLKMGLELSSPLGSEGGWDIESYDPSKQERLGDRFHAGVGERNDFWPTGEAIHAGE